MGKITLSSKEFKALASDTRVKILKSLKERQHNLSELSVKFDMSSPSIKQQLDKLLEAGLIQQKDEGRKWKYYFLTSKGKTLLEGEESSNNTFLILLSLSFFAMVGMLLFMSTNLPTQESLMGCSPVLYGGSPELVTVPMAEPQPRMMAVQTTSDAIVEEPYESPKEKSVLETEKLEDDTFYVYVIFTIVLAILTGFFGAKLME